LHSRGEDACLFRLSSQSRKLIPPGRKPNAGSLGGELRPPLRHALISLPITPAPHSHRLKVAPRLSGSGNRRGVAMDDAIAGSQVDCVGPPVEGWDPQASDKGRLSSAKVQPPPPRQSERPDRSASPQGLYPRRKTSTFLQLLANMRGRGQRVASAARTTVCGMGVCI
jgi:hypothetical protein